MGEGIQLPVLYTCPVGGEQWPMDGLKSSIDSLPRSGKQTMRTVHFWCPGHHGFNLAEALKAGVFTKEQADAILRYAQECYEKQMREWGLGTGRTTPDHRKGDR